MISIFDLFNIGIGPSSSHCIGPMRAAKSFVNNLLQQNLLKKTCNITIDLYGSLAFTGAGHGTNKALMLGLAYYDADTVEPDQIPAIIATINTQHCITTVQKHAFNFIPEKNIILHFKETLPQHSNGMWFKAYDDQTQEIFSEIYYSTGGGFIVNANSQQSNAASVTQTLPYPFNTAAELLEHCKKQQKSIAQIVFANELCFRTASEIKQQAEKIWTTMDQAITRGCHTHGELPGGLHVPRRAADLLSKLQGQPISNAHLDVYAMAVNEENAAGNRVVTAPTNGAAGIIPAVFKYYQEFYKDFSREKFLDYLLTTGAIGILFKQGASISGAEMGCQGEVGVACSMAAGGLTAILGGTIQQVEQAAEIGIEHNLGLTCDPIKGLVQIPCIERNAMGAVKAVNASTIALLEKGQHIVSLDNAIKTMRETGRDMSSHYKETSQGGLAVNVPEC